MGAYFKIKKESDIIKKTLIRKKNGSPYPTIDDLNLKIFLLKKYLIDNVVETKIIQNGKSIQLEQPFTRGKELFILLEKEMPNNFIKFVKRLKKFYSNTGMLPDLLDNKNILVTENNEIKIIDLWPLFFKERVKNRDLNEQSYKENLKKFNFLKMKAGLDLE